MWKSWIILTRLPNAAMAGLGVWLGAACLPGAFDWKIALMGFAGISLLAAGGNVQNDILDLPIDRLNRPSRPLVTGAIPMGAARVFALGFYAAALGAALILGPAHSALAMAMAVLLWCYNHWLKSLPLIGNFSVAALCALAIYFPEWPGTPWHTLAPAVFAFLTTLAREIVKDIEDMSGDGARGLRTFPLAFGVDSARQACRILLVLVLVLLPLPLLPFPALNFHFAYGFFAMGLAAPVTILALVDLSKPSPDWARSQKRLKFVMLAGMAAIAAGIVLK